MNPSRIAHRWNALLTVAPLALILLLGAMPTRASAAASPGGGLTLPGALETAKAHSPDLRRMELAADSASWGKLEALSEHLPKLDLRANHFFGAKYSRLGVNFGGNAVNFPSAFPQTQLTFEASLLLFDGLGAFRRYQAAGLEADAAELELAHARFALEERIQQRFFEALAAQELAKVADQNIETLEQHHKLAQASRRAGVSTNVEVLRIESQLEEARAERILAYDNVLTARQALNEAMGVEKDDRPLEGGLPIPDEKRVPKTLALDVARREDIQAQTDRERAQDRLRSAARGAWFPRVSLFATEDLYKYGSFDAAVIPNDSFRNAQAVGIRLAWNLFEGGATIARNARASNAAESAEQDTRKALIAAPTDFEHWKRRYLYNAALYEARKRSVEKSTESVRLATASVRAGTQTHSETLDAELELFRARAGVIRAQLDAAESLSQLELALGHRI